MATELFLYQADYDWRRPRDGVTALFIACLKGFEYITKDLLEAGANPNAFDNEGRTPLIYSVAYRATKCTARILKMLIDYGANIEARDHSRQAALLRAASTGHARFVEMLFSGELGQVAAISTRKPRGQTALCLAAKRNLFSVVQVLLKHSADPNVVADGRWTLLYPVAREDHVETLKLLLKAGALVNAQLSSRMTLLHLAAVNGH